VAAEETALRHQVLEELSNQVPSMIQAFVFDLMTGAVLARKGRGTSAIRVGLLAEKVPSLTIYLRDLVATEDADEVELIEVSTARVATLVAIVSEAQEAIAVLADKAQPTALISAALSRVVRSYASRLHPSRGAMIG
jgi:phosphoserine phosphatase